MNWSGALRAELASRAREWAQDRGVSFYESLGSAPTVLFERDASGGSHGNFHPDSWRAICANLDWKRRLDKVHSQLRALPEVRRAAAKELDSCNSSDALLMNCFCFPGTVALLLGVSAPTSAAPVFGFPAALSLVDGTLDATEIDMWFGGLVVEAKLTEADFTARPEAHVLRYKNLSSCFDLASLPRDGGTILGYQLIRNVLAADQHNAGLVVLIDGRRPDLLHEWWRVHAAIKDQTLRLRCSFRTWQEVAAVSPPALREFLRARYGL